MTERFLPLIIALMLSACHTSKNVADYVQSHQNQQITTTAARSWCLSDTILFMPLTMPVDVNKDYSAKHIALPDQESGAVQHEQQSRLYNFPACMIVRHTQASEQFSDTSTTTIKAGLTAEHGIAVERAPLSPQFLSFYILSVVLFVLIVYALLTARS